MSDHSRPSPTPEPPRPVPWEPSAPVALPLALRARLLAATRAAPAKTTRDLATRRWVLLVAAALPALGVLGGLGVGLKGRPLALGLVVWAGWSLTAVACTAVAFAGRSPLGPSRRALAALGALAPVAALTISMLGMALYPDTWTGALEPAHHAMCVGLAFAMGSAPLGAMLLHLRGTDPVGPRARGAALGAVAGAWGGAGTMLLCPHHTPAHALLAHVLPVALFVGVGALVGGSVLALRPPTRAALRAP